MTTRRRRPLVAKGRAPKDRSSPRQGAPGQAQKPTGQASRMAVELKALRARLGGFGDDLPTTPGDWHAAAWDYDQALVVAAETMGVPHPEPDMVLGRRRLTIAERKLIEKGLISMGFDLGPPPQSLPPGQR
ncbi:MAG: hypothetical protein KY441_04815 [Actinobacteria bacterium]|nr:hypothetical protein [Actinomycetota bacterium]